MAQVSLSSGSIMRPYRSPWGAFPVKHMIPISTNARIDVGRIVHLDYTGSTTVGQIVQSTADNHFYCVGVAASSMAAGSSGTANAAIPVWEANPMVEFRVHTKGGAVLSSLVGLRKKLVWDSTLAITTVDVGASTATDWRVLITGVPGEGGITGLDGALGDTQAEVIVRFTDRLGDQVNSTILSSTPVLAFYS